mmetsp:Transcript_22838/g.34082  ORF Transcript_22838/g.34082 Transcript_22838/m.34082 type:complete len:112 (+) Transcript_22838:873-1208(+)
MPPSDHGPNPPHDKSLPRLIRTERHELSINEFSSTRHTAEPGKGVVEDYEHNGERKPNESVVHVVHDIFELSDGEAEDEYRPTELIDLKPNMVLVHSGNTYDKGSGVEQKG